MSTVTIDNSNLTNIANAIRAKNRTNTTYMPNQMAAAISDILSGSGSYSISTVDNADGSQSLAITDNAGGEYSVAAIDNSDGTQSIAISDVNGGEITGLAVTTNGTYYKTNGGYSPVMVNVQPETVTLNFSTGDPSSIGYTDATEGGKYFYSTSNSITATIPKNSLVYYMGYSSATVTGGTIINSIVNTYFTYYAINATSNVTIYGGTEPQVYFD